MSINKIFDIVDGPNRELLVDSFKYAYDENVRIPLRFSIVLSERNESNDSHVYVPAKTKAWRITSLQHEDGSGQSFNIEGYCKAYLLPVYPSVGEVAYLSYRFKAYYSTKNRRGQIEMIEKY